MTAKGRSLHIGVRQPKQSVFGDLAAASGADNAALAMKSIASTLQYTEPVLLVNEKATLQNVTDSFRRLANGLEHGDILLITFSGHGKPHFDGGDGIEQNNQAFFLFDHRWVDDEIHQLLASIRVDARVILVFDACFSGTAIAIARLFDRVIARARSLVGLLTVDRVKKNAVLQGAHHATRPALTVNVLLLAACADDRIVLAAQPGHDLSPFTDALVKTWATSRDYKGLRDAIAPLVQAEGNPPPVLNTDLLRTDAFRFEKPFAING